MHRRRAIAVLTVALAAGLSPAGVGAAPRSSVAATSSTLGGPPPGLTSTSPAPAPGPAPAPRPSAGTARTLPMTGVDLPLELGIGALLIGAGAAARVASRPRTRRY